MAKESAYKIFLYHILKYFCILLCMHTLTYDMRIKFTCKEQLTKEKLLYIYKF